MGGGRHQAGVAGSGSDSTERLRRLRKEVCHSEGPERIAARRSRGAQSARERVIGLLDRGSFVELDMFIEGAVAGYGKIDGRDVYVFAEDGEARPSSRSELVQRKTAKVIDLAMKNGAPLVGLYDGGLLGRQKDAASLGRHSGLYFRSVMASGLIPQIAGVLGPCTGAAAFPPVLADITVMVKGSAQVFLADPADLPRGREEVSATDEAGSEEVATYDDELTCDDRAAYDDEATYGDEAAYEELGGARVHSEVSGLAHLAADDEAECLELIRVVLSYLPQNNLEEPWPAEAADPVDRMDGELESLSGLSGAHLLDMRQIVLHVVDEGSFLELSPRWAVNLITGFARLGGRSVGVVGNQPAYLDGRIDVRAAAKAARFIRFCDAFNLPVVTFVDTLGFVPGKEQEHGGIVRAAAKLTYAYCEASVPKISVVTRRAFAEGLEVMGSKLVGADFNFAWPGAEMGARAPQGALDRQDLSSPYEAAVQGYLDDVIAPVETRPRLIAALDACASKREARPPKKHGNIPL